MKSLAAGAAEAERFLIELTQLILEGKGDTERADIVREGYLKEAEMLEKLPECYNLRRDLRHLCWDMEEITRDYPKSPSLFHALSAYWNLHGFFLASEAFDLAAYRANDFYEAQERSIFESRFPVGTRVFVRHTKAKGTVVSHYDGNFLCIRVGEEERKVFAGNVSMDPDKD